MQWLVRNWKRIVLIIGYVVLAILLDLMSGAFVLQTGLAICYPPAGLYLAAILLLGWWALPLAFLNPVFSVLVTLHSPNIPLSAVLGIGAVSMISPAITLAILRRTPSRGVWLHTFRGLSTFLLVIALAETVECLAATSVYILTGLSAPQAFGSVAVGWWISNIIPYFTLTPVILLLINKPADQSILSKPRLVLNNTLIAISIPLAVWIALFSKDGSSVSRLYVALIPILWSALIGGVRGAAWASLVMTTSVLVLAPALLSDPKIVVEAQFFLLVANVTGLVTGVVVTERRHVEAALRDSEKRYRDIVENAIDGIFQSTPEGRFLRVNSAMAKMYGYDSPEDMVRSVTNIPEQLYADPATRDMLEQRLAQDGWVANFETLERRKDGSTFWVLSNVQVVRDDSGKISYYEGTVEDFTARKTIEAERESLIRELEKKNAELERFTYTVSHDLRAPLVTINGFLGFLEKDAASGNMERLKKDNQRIQEAVDKMQRLLSDLLELSRIGRLVNPPQQVAFADLVQEALAIVQGRLEAGRVRVTVQPDLPPVYGDHQRLVEVLQNLIDNAAKFMGEQPEPVIEIGCRHQEGKPVFFVRDNGIGIDPRFHDQVFGLFNKLNPHVEGTGVGLALVKRIIEVHGGKIWVESEDAGRGATFCFTLPYPPSRLTKPV